MKWTTGLEINNKLFDIQRSANGNSGWTSILTQTNHFARGNGNGDTYTVNDPLPLAGANYYRLVQQDLDGELHIDRQIVFVNTTGLNKFSFAPNPAVNGAVKLIASDIAAGNYTV